MFFKRLHVRGIKHLVFYGLPDNPIFYSELLNGIEAGPETSSLCLFDKFDKAKLERIVGSKRAKKILEGPKQDFVFC